MMPWEKYSATPDGPWAKYGSPEPPSAEEGSKPDNPDFSLGRLGKQMYRNAAQGVADVARATGAARRTDAAGIETKGRYEESVPTQGLFETREQVGDAFERGELSRGDAEQILKTGFKFQPSQQTTAHAEETREKAKPWEALAASMPEPLGGSPDGLLGIVEQAAGGMARFAPSMAVSALNLPAGTALTFSQLHGSKFDELKKKGVDDQRANEAAMISAAIMTPIEQAGTVVELGALKNLFKSSAKGFGAKARQFVGALLKSSAAEGIEEYLQQYPDEISTLWATNPDKPPAELANLVIQELPRIKEEAKQSAVVGAVGGAMMAGAGQVASTPFKGKAEEIESQPTFDGKVQVAQDQAAQDTAPTPLQKIKDNAANRLTPPDIKVLPPGQKLMDPMSPNSETVKFPRQTKADRDAIASEFQASNKAAAERAKQQQNQVGMQTILQRVAENRRKNQEKLDAVDRVGLTQQERQKSIEAADRAEQMAAEVEKVKQSFTGKKPPQLQNIADAVVEEAPAAPARVEPEIDQAPVGQPPVDRQKQQQEVELLADILASSEDKAARQAIAAEMKRRFKPAFVPGSSDPSGYQYKPSTQEALRSSGEQQVEPTTGQGVIESHPPADPSRQVQPSPAQPASSQVDAGEGTPKADLPSVEAVTNSSEMASSAPINQNGKSGRRAIVSSPGGEPSVIADNRKPAIGEKIEERRNGDDEYLNSLQPSQRASVMRIPTETRQAMQSESAKHNAKLIGYENGKYWLHDNETGSSGNLVDSVDQIAGKIAENREAFRSVQGQQVKATPPTLTEPSGKESPVQQPAPVQERRTAPEGEQNTSATNQKGKDDKPIFSRRNQQTESLKEFSGRIKEDLGLSQFDVYERNNGDIELSLLVVPKGERKKGKGSDAVRALAEYADIAGKRIFVNPAQKDDAHGTTSHARLLRFYSRFGFVRNTGRNKDFTLPPGMYRNPRVPLFQKRTPQEHGTQKAKDITRKINRVTSAWQNAPTVEVVQSQSDLPGDILNHLKAIGAETDVVDGTFYQGTVYLVADNLASEKAAIQTLLHESFGHYGLRELLGPRFGQILRQVYNSKKSEIDAIGKEYGFDTRRANGQALAADEWLSRHVSENEQSTWIDKIISAIRSFVRRIAPNLKFSDAEIRNLLDAARSRVVGTSPSLAGAGSGALSPIDLSAENALNQPVTSKRGAGITTENQPEKPEGGKIKRLSIVDEATLDNFIDHIEKDKTGGSIGIRGIYRHEVGKKKLKRSLDSVEMPDGTTRKGWLSGTSVIEIAGDWDSIPKDLLIENLRKAWDRVQKYGDSGFAIVSGDLRKNEISNDIGEAVFGNARVIAYIDSVDVSKLSDPNPTSQPGKAYNPRGNKSAIEMRESDPNGSLANYDDQSKKEWLAAPPPANGKLKLYRATPEGAPIKPGDYVTNSKQYALDHIKNNLGGKGKIAEIDATLDDIYPADGPKEFWYAPASLIDSSQPGKVGTELSSTTATGSITPRQVQKAFEQKGFKTERIGNLIRVKTPSGNLYVDVTDMVVENDAEAIKIGYGRSADPGEKVAGSYQNFDGTGTIRLKRNLADEYTLSHETFHHLKAAGIFNPLELATLKKAAGPGEEAQARWIEGKLRERGSEKGIIARLIQKVADWLDAFANLVAVTERGIVRGMESGEFLGRESYLGEDLTEEGGLAEAGRKLDTDAENALNQPVTSKRGAGDIATKETPQGPKGGKYEDIRSQLNGMSKDDFDKTEQRVGSNLKEALSRVVYAEEDYRLPNLGNMIPPDRMTPQLKSKSKRVKIYRAVEGQFNSVRPGDWVTLTRSYAKGHTQGRSGAKILELEVPREDVVWAGTDENEFFYAPKELARPNAKSTFDGITEALESIPNPTSQPGKVGTEPTRYSTLTPKEQGGHKANLSAKYDEARAAIERPLNDFMYWIVDKNHTIQAVQEKLDLVTEDIDLFLKETQRPKVTASRVKGFWDEQAKPFMVAIAKSGKTLKAFEEYAHAKHAPEANIDARDKNAKRYLDQLIEALPAKLTRSLRAEMAELTEKKRKSAKIKGVFGGIGLTPEDNYNFLQKAFTDFAAEKETQSYLKKWESFTGMDETKDDVGKLSGMSNAEAMAITAKADPEMESLRKMLSQINANRIDLLYDAGLIPQEEYEAIQDKFKFYVPLHREGYEDSLFGSSRGLNPTGKPIKTRGGSKRAVVDIVGNSIASYEKAINLAEKARSTRTLRDLVKANPDPELWTLKKEKKSPRLDQYGNVRMYPDLFNIADNEFRFMADQEQYILEANRDNKDMMLMIRNLKAADAQHGPILSALSKANQWLARINTSWSPEFVISNFARDIQTAGINIQDTGVKGKSMLSGAGKAIKAIWRVEKGKSKGDPLEALYGRFKDAGGKISWSDVHGSVEKLGKKISREIEMLQGKRPSLKAFRSFVDTVEAANTSIENGIRLHVFKLATEQGLSDSKAAQIASDITVDFTKKGAAGPIINSLYLFANAGIQGSYRIIRAASKSSAVRKSLAGVVGAGFTIGMANILMGGVDDDGEDYYSKIEDHIKERNAIFMIPGTKGKYAKIPLPWGYNLFWNIGNEAAAAIASKNYKPLQGAARLASTFANAFNPLQSGTLLQTLAPTIADPFAMVAENKNWFGGPLMPEKNVFDKTPDPDSERYWKSARKPSVWVASMLNRMTGGDKVKKGAIDVSPETLDLVIDTAGGSMLRFFTDIGAVASRSVGGEEVELQRVPFVRRVFGEKSEWADRTQYFRNLEDVLTVKEQLAAYEGTKYHRYISMSTRPEQAVIGNAKRTEYALKRLKKDRKAAEAQGDKARVKEIDAKIKRHYIEFNKRYNAEKSRY